MARGMVGGSGGGVAAQVVASVADWALDGAPRMLNLLWVRGWVGVGWVWRESR
jgi:hypothetical protein